MKKILILLPLFVTLSCAEDPNKDYIDKIAEKVKENDMGLDVGYRNIEFAWTDTIYDNGEIIGYQAENTYRMMVGTIDQKVTAIVTFDPDFNVTEIE